MKKNVKSKNLIKSCKRTKRANKRRVKSIEKRRRVISFAINTIVIAIAIYHFYSWINIPPIMNLFKLNVIAKGPTATAPTPISYKVDKSGEPVRIIIQKANINLPIVESYEDNKGNWKISSLYANYALGTAEPNSISGNVVIFGYNRQNIFESIRSLSPGDFISVQTKSFTFTYEVTNTLTVTSKDIEIMYPTQSPMLTLFTYDGAQDKNRFVVYAKYIYSN